MIQPMGVDEAVTTPSRDANACQAIRPIATPSGAPTTNPPSIIASACTLTETRNCRPVKPSVRSTAISRRRTRTEMMTAAARPTVAAMTKSPPTSNGALRTARALMISAGRTGFVKRATNAITANAAHRVRSRERISHTPVPIAGDAKRSGERREGGFPRLSRGTSTPARVGR